MNDSLQINLVQRLTGHRASIFALEQGTQAAHFYSGDGHGYIVQWDLNQQNQGTAIAQVPSNVFSMKLIPQAGLLAVGTMAGVLYFIDLDKQKVLEPPLQFGYSIFDMQVIENQLWLAIGNGNLEVIELENRTHLKSIKVSNKSLRSLQASEDLKQLVIGSSDNCIHLLDLENEVVNQSLETHTNSVFCVRFFGHDQQIIAGSRDAHISIWAREKTFKCSQKLVAHLFTVNDLAFNADESLLATASRDKSIKIWDVASWELLKVIDPTKEISHTNSVNKLLWHTETGHLLSAGDDRSIMVWYIQK